MSRLSTVMSPETAFGGAALNETAECPECHEKYVLGNGFGHLTSAPLPKGKGTFVGVLGFCSLACILNWMLPNSHLIGRRPS